VTSPLRLTTSSFFQLNTCCRSPYVTSALTIGWVCRLKLLLALDSAVILRPESCETHDHILHSQILDPPSWRPRTYIPQEQGGPVIAPGNGFPFRCLLRPFLHTDLLFPLVLVIWPRHGPNTKYLFLQLRYRPVTHPPGRTAQKTQLPIVLLFLHEQRLLR
jgi:hypothetical protein